MGIPLLFFSWLVSNLSRKLSLRCAVAIYYSKWKLSMLLYDSTVRVQIYVSLQILVLYWQSSLINTLPK